MSGALECGVGTFKARPRLMVGLQQAQDVLQYVAKDIAGSIEKSVALARVRASYGSHKTRANEDPGG